MPIVKAEYEEQGKEGIIRLWPAPDPMEGKAIAQGILEMGTPDPWEELEEAKDDLLKSEDAVDDLQEKLSDIEDELRAALDSDDIVAAIKELLAERF